jgi:hypothetical protein
MTRDAGIEAAWKQPPHAVRRSNCTDPLFLLAY